MWLSIVEIKDFYQNLFSRKRRCKVCPTPQNPTVLKRITDTELYGNEYPLVEVFEDLTDAVFEADAKGSVNSFRRNLQAEYVDRLALIASEKGAAKYHSTAQALAVLTLSELRDQLASKRRGDRVSQAHAKLLVMNIDRAMDSD